MKKLNNRGFTLVEVLAVVAILAIIMVIAIPNISSSIERSNDKKNEAMEKVFKSEAGLYISKYKASINISYGNSCYIDIDDLVAEGYLEQSDIEDYDDSCLVYDGVNFEFYQGGLDASGCDDVSTQCYDR